MLLNYIKSDLCRYVGKENINVKNFIKYYLLNTGFKFSLWLRLSKSNNRFLKNIAKLQHKRFSIKYMLDIPIKTQIGFGLYIGHGQCIVINPTAVIGNNVNLSQFTTIGSNHNDAANIGDNVYIGPSVCIIENVEIGENSINGAGSVVTKNVPSSSIVAGVPAKKINNEVGVNRYIKNPW